MLQIIFPLTFIPCTVYVDIYTIAVCFVVDPIAFVNIPVNMNKFSLAMSSVIFPISFVACTIWPHLLSIAISKASNPLSKVGCSRFKGIEFSFLSLGIWIINGLRNSFFLLIHRKIAAISSFRLSDQSDLLSSCIASPKCLQFYNKSGVSSKLCQVSTFVTSHLKSFK